MGLYPMQHQPHQQQGQQTSQQQTQYPRPSSIVQPHHSQASQNQQQHHSSYQASHPISSVYPQTSNQSGNSQTSPEGLPYYAHSTYNTPGASSGYTSAASVASPAQHDHHQHRGIYGQPPAQSLQQTMYYPPQQQQYQPIASQQPQSAYGQHPPVGHQTHQTMTSQPTMMMAQTASHNPLGAHQHQHPHQHQHQHQHQHHNQHQHPHQHQTHHSQQPMSNSPRIKMSPQPPVQLQKPQQAQPLAQSHSAQNGNAPLTTPTMQWIAFEYSRDRVKMQYTIRCDVESVNTDELAHEFKTENCVYPRACCPKDQYRGNRQVYETECNTVGWALAQLNPALRGKRGLIQRAVDSWRNSNQDPRLRSRRVRRMAKLNNRKAMQGTASQSPHLAGHGGPGMSGAPPHMGPGPTMTKPSLNSIPQAMHHHPGHSQEHDQGAGDAVGMFQQM
ncbi:unnamed protein product [Parascedosporium putredinis]|uniref:DUF8032 domain-containing protein n=1 Tax=Parascedosporium putredinis TaxID=1442378 RepID=A0A9P1GW39_9PEZI|nr:unnamed protein product [Parascedosporium putredinis]CAI7988111.1 unnamed protein product [Parascedosporium putredinis]